MAKRKSINWAGFKHENPIPNASIIGNLHAKEFYLSCGFEILGPFETRFGSGLLMRKAL